MSPHNSSQAVCRVCGSGFRVLAIAYTIAALPAVSHGSTYGFSINLNFAGDQDPIIRSAGYFSERVWNNLPTDPDVQDAFLLSDAFNDFGQSPARSSWNARGIGNNDIGRVDNPDDGRMMQSYLASPATIKLTALDLVPPPHEGPLNYTVLLYTFGGRDGANGTFTVNGDQRSHIDSGTFDGTFRTGLRGNMLVFSDLQSPDLLILTDGFAPLNAMSVMYCRPGDLNGDGMIDVTDLDELSGASKNGSKDWKYDINIDGQVTNDDVLAWIKWSKGTCIGDVNLDGVFNSSDLVQLFQVGIYEKGDVATWTTGDWNGDCEFNSSDLLLAFQEGCYDSGDAPAIPAEGVPEPTGMVLFVLGIISWVSRNRSR